MQRGIVFRVKTIRFRGIRASFKERRSVMKSFILLLTLSALSISGFADTLHVPAEYPTIASAINVANPGDTVLVAPGIYTSEYLFFDSNKKDFTVKSSAGPHFTVIDEGTIVFSGVGPDSILEGFTITNGTGYHDYYIFNKCVGGGIFCLNASPIIKNNIITGNRTQGGGGICCYGNYHSYPLNITGNIIEGNVVHNFSYGNGEGGGIYLFYSRGKITNNIIRDNKVEWAPLDKIGGGIYLYQCFDMVLANNVISSNEADDGGGIGSVESYATILNNTIAHNTAISRGGGIFCYAGSYLQVYNTILWGNNAPVPR